MRTTLRAIALGLVATLALAGCLRIDMSITLNEDDTADGSFLMAVEKGSGEAFEMTDEDLVEQFSSETGADFENGTVEPYEDGTHIGQLITFTGEPLAGLDEGDGSMSITRDGDDYVVAGAFDATGGEDMGSIPGAEMTLAITFPGPVSEHNGTLEGTTVTWDLMTLDEDLSARGAASPDTGLPLWAWIAIGAGVLVLAGIAVVLVVVRRRPAPAGEAAFAPYAPVTDAAAAPAPTGTFEPVPAPAAGDTAVFAPPATPEAVEAAETAPIEPSVPVETASTEPASSDDAPEENPSR